MASCLAIALLAQIAASSPGPYRDREAFESDSVRAVLIRVAAPGPGRSGLPDAPPMGLLLGPLCDSARDSSAAAAEWYRVEVFEKPEKPEMPDKDAHSSVRFPADGKTLREGLRQACLGGEEGREARIADALKDLAARLRVRMRDGRAGAME